MSATATTKENVMGQVIPRQHPAVVLKSHYKAVRALLAAALIAIVALAVTVVIVANDDNSAKVSAQPQAAHQQAPGTRFDGGPDEGTRGLTNAAQGFKARAGGPRLIPMGPRVSSEPQAAQQQAPGTRFDGGPDEGTRGLTSAPEASTARAGGPRMIPMGPSN
jgi:hypothetical protein